MSEEKETRVELLAPAKNFMAIKASGPYADAVYFGVQQFNMRALADNFELEELPRVVKMCHNPDNPKFRKRKCYLTTNILIYEEELDDLYNTILAAKEAGVDAVIVHDHAAIKFAKEIGIPFHISTQCNVSNSVSARYYEELGAERIVLARECTLQQIKKIANKLTRTQIEAFVHGAMCSSVSGRCYLSQTIYGTAEASANRGLCKQPCRLKWTLLGPNNSEFIYDGQRILNSKDLCMIRYIPQLIEAGIKSFKIEGRMRDPMYVETVSRVYREAIDAYYSHQFRRAWKERRWMDDLKKVYNRGFTTGFYFGQATIEDSQLTTGANLSHWRLIEMGKIIGYDSKNRIARVDLFNGTLRKGDDLVIMSNDRAYDTFFHQKVSFLKVRGKLVDKTPRGNKNNPIKVLLGVDEPVNSGGIDSIFKFTNETYKSGSYELQ